MRYRAALFDLFGTLVPPFPSDPQGAAEFAAALGVDSYEAFRRVWSATRPRRDVGALTLEDALHEVRETLGLPAAAERVAAAAALRYAFFRRVMRPRPDAVDTLRRARALGVATALLSNCSEEGPTIWPESPLEPLFDVALFSCEVGCAKPDARIYRRALDTLAVAPSDAIYVANGERGELAGAVAVGVDAILLHVDGEQPGDEAAGWTGRRIRRLEELLDLLAV